MCQSTWAKNVLDCLFQHLKKYIYSYLVFFHQPVLFLGYPFYPVLSSSYTHYESRLYTARWLDLVTTPKALLWSPFRALVGLKSKTAVRKQAAQ